MRGMPMRNVPPTVTTPASTVSSWFSFLLGFSEDHATHNCSRNRVLKQQQTEKKEALNETWNKGKARSWRESPLWCYSSADDDPCSQGRCVEARIFSQLWRQSSNMCGPLPVKFFLNKKLQLIEKKIFYFISANGPRNGKYFTVAVLFLPASANHRNVRDWAWCFVLLFVCCCCLLFPCVLCLHTFYEVPEAVAWFKEEVGTFRDCN